MRYSLIAAAGVALIGAPLLLEAADQSATPQPDAAPAATSTATTRQGLDLFAQALDIVRTQYVEPIDDRKLIEAALSGMVSSLDPHSSYLTKDAYEEMRVQTRGAYGGLGIEITQEGGAVKVVSPIDDTPAAAAGIKPGDVIAKVDGSAAADFSLSELVTRLRGPIGSKVMLTLERSGREPFEVTLQRAEIHLKSVKWHLEGDDVGYVRITSFIENTDRDLKAAIADLKAQVGKKRDGKLLGLVLDLRNDPGGLVDQAVAVGGEFLEKGEIVSLRGRKPDDIKHYTASPGDLVQGVPIVVLINGGSASAAEIVAGALHDDHRAILMGTRTFGKGSVQTIIPLGGNGALRLTTARYYTPSGRSIQAEGITPDVEVEAGRITPLAQTSRVRESDLRGALKNPDQAAAAPTQTPAPATQPAPAPNVPPGTTPAGPAKSETVEATLLGTPSDYQLARAVDLLRGVAKFKQGAEN